MSVASEYKQLLSVLDERLVTVLTKEDIRLLRVEWLLAQREDYKIPRRQELERLERADRGLSPFLTGEEAAALIRNGAREVGALSYGWLLPWDPDPTRERLRLLQRVLKQKTYIKAIFWDQATLYQPPRIEREQAAFDRALDVMMDLYASAIGTTVLQIKDIPRRPTKYDGLLCLGGIQEGTDEKTITAALQRFGEIERCMPPDRVKFKDHSAAEEATKAPKVDGLKYDYAFPAYKSVPYDDIDSGGKGRGWCICESALAGELVARLRASPKITAALAVLPPKMLRLAADEEPLEIEPEAVALADRVSMVVSRLEKGTFASQSDHEKVPKLYVGYVKRIARQLQTTLALAGAEDTQLTLPAIPSVSAPVADLLKLVDGQLLLQLSDAASRRAGGEGASPLSAEQGGLQPYKLLMARDAGLLLDSCSQVVLPWRPPAEGWAAPFLQKVERINKAWTLQQRVNEINAELKEGELEDVKFRTFQERRASLQKEKDEITQTIIPKLQDQMQLPVLQKRVKEIDAELKEGEEEDEICHKFLQRRSGLQKEKEHTLGILKAWPDLEKEREHTLGEYRATGGVGERCYGAGQWLTVRQPDGQWTDAQVSTDGAPPRLADGQELALHPWNHAPRELVKGDYEMLREWWMRTLRVEHSNITDALTGKRLDVLQQCVAVNMEDAEERDDVQDARTLARLLHAYHADRCKGGAVDTVAAALLTGPPAAGKTSLMSQVIVYSLKSEMVPILIKVQQLQRRLIAQPDDFGTAWNWVDAFLRRKYHDQPAVYRFLRQALLSRRLLLLLDGLDEGGAKQVEIQRHVTEVLALQGHVMLCTSRPAGLTESSFLGFRRLYLSPLTEQQQEEALEQRLGATAVVRLLEYLKKMPVGDDGQRVTSNPLMLSMIASVYELRQGVGMPETIAELYEHASEAMLSRGGASSKELRRLMQTVFFEAHVAGRREIEDWQLDKAALSLELPERLDALIQMRECVANDKLPLFSLLETEPLKLQSSHLSFQEYFAARALCEEGTRLSGVPPWQWSAWWKNVVKLGSEMDGFGSGMLRAAGVQGDTLSLSRELGGDWPTVLMALCTMLKGSQIIKLNVDGHTLQIDELKGTTLTEKIDLSGKFLGVASAISIASCIKGNSVLKELNLARNALCGLDPGGGGIYTAEGITKLCEGLKGSAVTSLDLAKNRLGSEGGVALAEGLKGNTTLQSLNLYRNNIRDEGASALAAVLKETKITHLNLGNNQLCGLDILGRGTYTAEGITMLCEGLKGSAVTSLDLHFNNLDKEAKQAVKDAAGSGVKFQF